MKTLTENDSSDARDERLKVPGHENKSGGPSRSRVPDYLALSL